MHHEHYCPYCAAQWECNDPECQNSDEYVCDECDECDEYGNSGDDIDFANPGGHSALRAETQDNPRNLPCPTCGEPDTLTPADVRQGYQCDQCADRLERGGY